VFLCATAGLNIGAASSENNGLAPKGLLRDLEKSADRALRSGRVGSDIGSARPLAE
jgi:hypothetical protein